MSKSSRTTYRPDRHPKNTREINQAISANPVIQGLSIAIEVMPAINLEQLRATYEEAIRQPMLPLLPDQTAWKYALSTEISRCSPKPAFMKRRLEHPAHPTQHARIDPSQDLTQLKDILKPETLRRTFISIPALMAQIRCDIGDYLMK
jgi:hypothetical protein